MGLSWPRSFICYLCIKLATIEDSSSSPNKSCQRQSSCLGQRSTAAVRLPMCISFADVALAWCFSDEYRNRFTSIGMYHPSYGETTSTLGMVRMLRHIQECTFLTPTTTLFTQDYKGVTIYKWSCCRFWLSWCTKYHLPASK